MVAGFLEYLIDRVGPQNVHYVLAGGPATVEVPALLHCVSKPNTLVALGKVMTRTGTRRSSLQESLLRTRRVREGIFRTLDRVAPALAIYDTIRTASTPRRTETPTAPGIAYQPMRIRKLFGQLSDQIAPSR